MSVNIYPCNGSLGVGVGGGVSWKIILWLFTLSIKGISRIWVCKGKFLFARHEGVRRIGDIPLVFPNLETMLRQGAVFPSVWRVPVPIEFGGRYFIMGIICILQLSHKVRCKVSEFLYVTSILFCNCQWTNNNGKHLQLLAKDILFSVCHTFRP